MGRYLFLIKTHFRGILVKVGSEHKNPVVFFIEFLFKTHKLLILLTFFLQGILYNAFAMSHKQKKNQKNGLSIFEIPDISQSIFWPEKKIKPSAMPPTSLTLYRK